MDSCAENINTKIDHGLTQKMLGESWWNLYHEYAPFRLAGAEYRSIIRQAFHGGYLDKLNPDSVVSGEFREHHEAYLKTRGQLELEGDDGVSEGDEGVSEEDEGASEEDEGVSREMLGDVWWRMYHEYAPFRIAGAEYRSIIRQAFQGGYLDELDPYSVTSGDLREHHEEYLKTQ